MTSDLLPCPFCDSKNIGVERSECGRCGYAVCDDCGAEGPVVNAFRDGPDAQVILIPFQDEAISLWNTRPSPSVERMLPELPDGMLLTECGQEEGEDGWYATCVRVEPYEVYTAHSTSPRAAILAALKLIGGAG